VRQRVLDLIAESVAMLNLSQPDAPISRDEELRLACQVERIREVLNPPHQPPSYMPSCE
jgi:hypothetical protein